MSPRTIVITGASDGIGAAAARRLAAAGDRVAVVGRNPRKVEAVAADTGADPFVADFSRLGDVHRLAHQLSRTYERIDVLANNAGAIAHEHRLTEDGHELTLQVNHLAPFLLTNLLLAKLIASRASVIATSSAAARVGRIDLGEPGLEKGWSMWHAYADSKLMNLLFTRALHRHHALDGLSAAAFHPGVVASSFGAGATGATRWFYSSRFGQRVMITPDRGADTLVWLATGRPPRDWAPGNFFVKRRPHRLPRAARDAGLLDDFWAASAALVG